MKPIACQHITLRPQVFLGLIFLFIGACIARPSLAEERKVIAAAELSGLFQTNTKGLPPSGVYYQLLSQILSETELAQSYQVVVMPMKRAKANFLRRNFACYSPGLETFSQAERDVLPDELLSSQAFNMALVRVVSTEPHRLVSGVEDVTSNDVVSLVRGIPVSAAMQHMMSKARRTFTVQTELENLKLLISGRVNLIFAFYPDIVFAYKELGIEAHFPYQENYSPLVIRDNIVCHSEHKQAFDLIEAKIIEYRQSGMLRTLLKDFYLDTLMQP